MTETVSGAAKGASAGQAGLTIERLFSTEGVHPYDELTWERRDVVQTELEDRRDRLRAARRGVPRLLVGQRLDHRHHQVLPRRRRHRRPRVEPQAAHRPGREDLPQGGRGPRLLRDARRRRAVRARADLAAGAPVLLVQLPGLVQRRHRSRRSRSSACQPYDALVSTPAGTGPDRQAGGGATPSAPRSTTRTDSPSVMATKANGVKNVLRIHTKAGYALDVTADHLVWKSHRRRHAAGSSRPARFARRQARVAPSRLLRRGRDRRRGDRRGRALAGWMQSDGFVGQYDHGTNKSLTMEAMTVTPAELAWVTDAIDVGLPRRAPPRAQGRHAGPVARLPPHPPIRQGAFRRSSTSGTCVPAAST